MIVKDLKDMAREERDERNEVWVSLLNLYCHADEYTGNRPCDNGVLCDRCHYDRELQSAFLDQLVIRDLPVAPSEVHWYNDRVGGTCLFKCCGEDYKQYSDQRVTLLHQYTKSDGNIDVEDVGVMFKVRAEDGTEFDVFEDEITDWQPKIP